MKLAHAGITWLCSWVSCTILAQGFLSLIRIIWQVMKVIEKLQSKFGGSASTMPDAHPEPAGASGAPGPSPSTAGPADSSNDVSNSPTLYLWALCKPGYLQVFPRCVQQKMLIVTNLGSTIRLLYCSWTKWLPGEVNNFLSVNTHRKKDLFCTSIWCTQ